MEEEHLTLDTEAKKLTRPRRRAKTGRLQAEEVAGARASAPASSSPFIWCCRAAPLRGNLRAGGRATGLCHQQMAISESAEDWSRAASAPAV